jgi:hypothetical protein
MDGTDLALGSTLADGAGERRVADLPTRLGDRYRLVRVLGHGGMGSVYLAVDEALGCKVALKRILAPGDALARLRDEVLLAQKVTHPNVCRTYDLEELDGTWLVKMEYVAGTTLAEQLKKARPPVAETVRVARDICAGLAAAHRRGVVHRDLKPHNVMIEAQTGRVVLMDFGIARAAELAGQTAENISGTPDYMAPEQVRGREVDARADLYSLGCVLHEMLAGAKVFSRSTPMAAALAHVEDPPPPLPPAVPRRLRRLVAQLLEKDPARRPPSADAVAAALSPGPSRWRLVAVVAALVAVAAAGLVLRTRAGWRPVVRELHPGSEEENGYPAFSPDGTSIAYGSNRSGEWRITIESLVDGRTRVVGPPFQMIFPLRWTRDGRAVLLDDQTGNGLRVSIDGGAAERLGAHMEDVDDCGGRLVYVSYVSPQCTGCPRLVVRDADGRDRDLDQRPIGSQIKDPRCDAAGQRVVYGVMAPGRNHGQADIWLAPLDGGSPRKLRSEARPAATFTPDGRSVVISTGPPGSFNLWALPLDGGRPVQLTFGEGFRVTPEVSPDGRTLAFLASRHGWSWPVYAHAVAGGARRKVTAMGGEGLTDFHVTPDGRQIIATAERDEGFVIVSVSTGDGEEKTLVPGRLGALTPDGRELVYTVPGRVLARPLEGGADRTVAMVARHVGGIEVGPDATVYLGLAGDGGHEVWQVPLAGGELTRALPAPWAWIVPAPRGGWRIAFDGDGAAHVLPPGAPVDDPAARVLRRLSEAVWSRDGASVVYVAGDKAHRLEVATGRDDTLFDVVLFGGLAVSPDGGTVYTGEWYWPRHIELITNLAER